jgi:PKD repeat protein
VVRSSGGFAVSGSHNYQKNGTYTVAIRISDAGGSVATTTITIAVT